MTTRRNIRATLAATTAILLTASALASFAKPNASHTQTAPGNIPRSELAKGIDALDQAEASAVLAKNCKPFKANTKDCVQLITNICANIVTLLDVAKQPANAQEQCDAHRWCDASVYNRVPIAAGTKCNPPITYK